MTEEEYFRKNYPNSCYGDKPLSPHWDFFQDGVEFGERQSEKRIEELEQNVDYYAKRAKSAESHIIRQNERIAELKKENTALRQDWEVMKKHHSRDYNDFCDKYMRLEKENAELKAVERMALYSKMSDQLVKAKEHIENLLYYTKQCTCERSNYAEIEEDIKEAEQFLREVEK